ncbi:hypothetical protein ABTB51_19605, partial [Acinetobacter baumannii]
LAGYDVEQLRRRRITDPFNAVVSGSGAGHHQQTMRAIFPMSSMSRPRSRRILFPGIVLPLAASLPFFWLWYSRYLRIDFNELGRHYDATT